MTHTPHGEALSALERDYFPIEVSLAFEEAEAASRAELEAVEKANAAWAHALKLKAEWLNSTRPTNKGA